MVDARDAARPGPPRRLVLVRHAESLGNVADREAHERRSGRLELDVRDADVELSDVGRRQAEAIGRYLASDRVEQPDVVLCSPYRRALSTAELALDGLARDGEHPRRQQDERLRERDLGVFDGLTGAGVREQFPEESDRRSKQGKFYYRPAGGESWCDVVLRVRSLLRDVNACYAGQDVWMFSHRAVIMSLRVAIEGLDEVTALRIDDEQPMANCSITTFEARDGRLELVSYADSSAVDAAAPLTHEPESAGRGEDGADG
jgi:broad specificity phosphatase PhoE